MKKIVVSACLGFMKCRYDGAFLGARRIKMPAGPVVLIPVCPELAIGLGTPRKKIRLVRTRQGTRLIQPSTGRDLTEGMRKFARRFLKSLNRVDGFILKSKSPSCGIEDVRVYSGAKSRKPVSKGTGLFAAEVLRRFHTKSILNEKNVHFLRTTKMRITIKVKPNSRTEAVEKAPDGEYVVRVKAPPVEGRANEAVRGALAAHFGIPKSRILIKHGSSGKRKLVDIIK